MTTATKTHYLNDQLKGRKIVKVVYLTSEDIKESFGWYCDEAETTVLVLDNGDGIVLMQDPEGNGPGFGEVVQLNHI